jgi:cyclopropane fatty-acyl-phospholipid synthase-like methyltransferase
VAGLIAQHLPAGSRLADVGAGITPLAPFLASRGYVVETVDPSENLREWPPQPEWNEWGFLDYAAAGLAHRSWNCTLDQVPRTPAFDGIYSISVIEHVPANVRRALLDDISARTRPGGLVALTIDLVPDSDELWNLNLGVVVEPRAEHGNLHDVLRECAAVGLEVLRHEVVRDWGDSRVDVALLVLQRTDPSARKRWRDLGRRAVSMTRRSRR